MKSVHRGWLRGKRRLCAWTGRLRRGTLRVTLGTRILLVLVAVVTASAAVTVFLQDSSLSADLRRASRRRLERAAGLAAHLLDQRLAAQVQSYRMVASSPQFCANVEAGDGPTLAYFAEQLRPVHHAAAILFVDADGREVAGAGEPELRVLGAGAVRQKGRDGAPATALLERGGTAHAVVAVSVQSGGDRIGRLVAVEAIRPLELEVWSRLCRARVHLGQPPQGDGASVLVRRVGALQLFVAASFAEEEQALANSRENLLAGGMAGLAIALAASLLLVRSLVRPIRAIQQAAERIGAGQLGVRLDEGRNDEVGDVARSFNQMLDRLQHNMRERARFANQASLIAFHDTLTGLPNRRRLKQQLSSALESAPDKSRIAVVCLDLDRFQNVNDTLGHTAGDTLLLEVACRLHDSIEAFAAAAPEQKPVLARLGGDEFAVVANQVGDRDEVGRLADALLAALARPFDVDGHEVTVGASLGIAMALDAAADADALLRSADMAMCHAKGRGGRGYEFFADSMEAIAARRFELENRLRRALDNGEFELFFQPKLDVASDRVTAVEALLRWRVGEGQFVSPEEFVPMAEQTGAIVAIGEWVLRTAVAQCLAWQQDGLLPLRVSVNVSPRQMERGDVFFTLLRDLLAESGLEPRCLELEITEGSLLRDEDAIVALLDRVRELGVGVALDDFGTGYSSLSYLRRLPIDTLKIDRSFVRDLELGAGAGAGDGALIGSIVTMAKALGLRVVVEGVETRAQRRFLEELGCDELQGYLIGRPLPAVEVAELLRQRRTRSRLRGRGAAGTDATVPKQSASS